MLTVFYIFISIINFCICLTITINTAKYTVKVSEAGPTARYMDLNNFENYFV